MSASTAYEGWAVVELFGHVRLAGKISGADQYGVKMLRVDVPEVDGRPRFTSYKGGSALYAVTPCSEEVGIAIIRQERPAPPIPYALQQRALAAAPPDAEEIKAAPYDDEPLDPRAPRDFEDGE